MSAADVIVIGGGGIASGTTVITLTTVDQSPQQILIGLVIAAGKAFVFGQTVLG
jgi:hypothetical protein